VRRIALSDKEDSGYSGKGTHISGAVGSHSQQFVHDPKGQPKAGAELLIGSS